jgi:acetolactate synthase small subunit
MTQPAEPTPPPASAPSASADGVGHHVFVIRVVDRPGALTTVASVFSSRGVSLEDTVVGTGTEGVRLLLGFRASVRKRETLVRVLRRLACVLDVQAHPYDSPRLRAVAAVRVAPDSANRLPAVPAEVRVETVSESPDGRRLLLTGPTAAVESALEALRSRGLLLDYVKSVMAV